jgi:hypothetical protein
VKIRTLRRLAAALAGVAALACASAPWDLARLEGEHPRLAAISQHRLVDATPYPLPANGSIAFFLCRWPSAEPIPVSLPPDVTADELSGFEAVMRAWEGAGLGIRFTTGQAPGAGIEIRFIEPETGATETVYAANTIADCAVAPEARLAVEAARVLPAKIVFASIHMWRGGFDVIGRPVPHSMAEFVGSALHEFGHALGFQGHAAVGGSIMVKEHDAARRAGQRLLKGRPFADPTLRALYALPSGTVVKRAVVGTYRTETVDRLARLAPKRGIAGPFVRVGDRDGFLAWRDGPANRYRLRIPDVRKVLREPQTLWVEANSATFELLDPESP